MKQSYREAVLRGAALLGLGMSALLLAEYWHLPVLCTSGGGCDTVRLSPYAHVLGIPVPIIGAAFFSAVLGIAIAPSARRWLFPLGAAGALAAAVFIGIQALVLHAFCKLCLVVDLSALVIGAVAFTLRQANPGRLTFARQAAYAGVAVVVSVGAMLWHASLVPADPVGAVPPVVMREQKPNQVTIVEFVDFQCPACREQYGHFSRVLASYTGRVNVVLKNLPLPQHQHAIDAARTFCCAAESGEGRQMADRLFLAEELQPKDCEEIAVSLGLDRDEFRRCIGSERVAERLRADQQDAAAAGVSSLPTFWIGEERFVGVQDDAALRSSIERALPRHTSS